MYCSKCGAENPENVTFCGKCGQQLTFAAPTNPVALANTTTVVNLIQKKKNGLGIAGFVTGLIGLVFSWLVFPIICSALGLVFSSIGLFKSPRGLAIAGLIVSTVAIVLSIIFFIAFGIALSKMQQI